MSRLLFKRIHSPLVSMRFKTIITETNANKHERMSILVPVIEQMRRHMRTKQTVWGIANIYHPITLENLSTILNRPIEKIQIAASYCQVKDIKPTTMIKDIDIIKRIITMLGYKYRFVPHPEEKCIEIDRDIYPRPPASIENLRRRPPVVTVMGHVDHGKTTLLDSLRNTNVAKYEAGGITQHIGAFTVDMKNGEKMTFLDTPGHAAFRLMRARGAHCTDIIVLVIAAEDGVMPQTKEVLNLIREGDVPVVVAINKIDAPGANIEQTKRDLIENGLNLELGHGIGNVKWVCISALYGTNLDQLADTITTQAILMDLKSEYTGLVEGIIIESKKDSRRGKIATMLVTRGTLRKGCILVAGTGSAKVRDMFDHNQQSIESVTPGVPVEILGWHELPDAGDRVLEVENGNKANTVVEYRKLKVSHRKAINELDVINEKRKAEHEAYKLRRTLSIQELIKLDRAKRAQIDTRPILKIIVKADVHGSLEAILGILRTYNNVSAPCKLGIVHSGVGPVIEGDIRLATIFKAIIYTFSLSSPKENPKRILIKEFDIIYKLIDDVKEEINKRLPEIAVDEIVGAAEVLQLFHNIDVDTNIKSPIIVQCQCTDGILEKKLKFKLMRNGECIYDGRIISMQYRNDEVHSIDNKEMGGIQLADNTILPEIGDQILCYATHNRKQTVDWNPGF